MPWAEAEADAEASTILAVTPVIKALAIISSQVRLLLLRRSSNLLIANLHKYPSNSHSSSDRSRCTDRSIVFARWQHGQRTATRVLLSVDQSRGTV